MIAAGSAGHPSPSVATGKLFEYLGARRPVLVLGEHTEAARIVASTGAGVSAPATDPSAVATALARLVDGEANPTQRRCGRLLVAGDRRALRARRGGRRRGSLTLMARILVLSFSDLSADPRPDRQLEALAGRHELVAAGLGAPAGDRARYIELRPAPDPLAARVNQAAGLSRIVARRYRAAYWGNRQVRTAYERLRDLRPDAVISNDVHTLPLALRVAGGAPVLADAHEYYPEHFIQVRWWRYVMAPYFDWLCREYMPLAAAVTTVSPGIAGLYRDRMGVEADLITNAPRRADLRPGPVGDPVRLFHHGSADPAGASSGRLRRCG